MSMLRKLFSTLFLRPARQELFAFFLVFLSLFGGSAFVLVFCEMSLVAQKRRFLYGFVEDLSLETEKLLARQGDAYLVETLQDFYSSAFVNAPWWASYRVECLRLGIYLSESRVAPQLLENALSEGNDSLNGDFFTIYARSDDKDLLFVFWREFFDFVRVEKFLYCLGVVAFLCCVALYAYAFCVRACENVHGIDPKRLKRLSELVDADDTLRAALEYSRWDEQLRYEPLVRDLENPE